MSFISIFEYVTGNLRTNFGNLFPCIFLNQLLFSFDLLNFANNVKTRTI